MIYVLNSNCSKRLSVSSKDLRYFSLFTLYSGKMSPESLRENRMLTKITQFKFGIFSQLPRDFFFWHFTVILELGRNFELQYRTVSEDL